MKSKLALLLIASVGLVASGLVATSADAVACPDVTKDPSACFEPDANSRGSVLFYDANGTRIYGGSPGTGYPLSHIAEYLAASTASNSNSYVKATAYVGIPDSNKLNTLQWTSVQISGSTTFPVVGAPAPVGTSPNPTARLLLSGGDGDIASVLQSATLSTTPGWSGLVQIRLKDAIPAQQPLNTFWDTVISYDVATQSWAQVYPAPPSLIATTVSTPSTTPAPTAGKLPRQVDVTLSTTVTAASGATAHPAGTVTFSDGATLLGTATYDTVTGVATLAIGKPADGVHHYSATFTPTDAGAYTGNTNNDAASNPTLSVVVVPLPTTFGKPTVSGVAKVGSILTCSQGVWSNASTYVYTWYYGASAATATTVFKTGNPSGALPASVVNKYVVCKVTGTNLSGSATGAASTAVKVAPGAAPKTVTGKGAAILGVKKVGQKLTASKGTWTPVATYTYSYVWKRFTKGKTGAFTVIGRAATYKTVAADKGKNLVVVVTAKRAGYLDGTSTSAPALIG